MIPILHAYRFRLRIHFHLLARQGAIDHMQKRQGAGLDDVGADGAAPDSASFMLRLDVRFALGVLAYRDAAHLELFELDILHAGDALDGLEDGVDRPIAHAGFAVERAVLVPEHHGGMRHRTGTAAARHRFQRPDRRPAIERRFRQGFDVGVVNVLFAVGQRLETFENLLQLLIVKMEAQVPDAVLESVPAAVLAQDQLGLSQTHIFRPHDFVGAALLEHAVLMNAGFVGKSVLADDGLVALHVDAGDARDQPAGGTEALGVDGGAHLKVVRPRVDGHHHFFQSAVAGPFTQAVDRAFHLAGAFFQCRQAIGDRQAQVIVAVHAQDDLVDAADVLFEMADGGGVLLGNGIANGVGDVDGGGPGGDRLFHDLGQEIELGAGRVFGRKLHVLQIALGPLDAGDGAAHDLFLGHAQLEFAMDGAGGQEHVDARPLRLLQGLPGAIDVVVVAPGQAANRRPVHLPGNHLHRLEIPWRGDGKTGLDDVHAKFLEGVGDFQLFSQVHARAGRLLAVAQGRVENNQAVVAHRRLHSNEKTLRLVMSQGRLSAW